MQWNFMYGYLHVRCRDCLDFFAVDHGTDVAREDREGREAETLHGRPIRSLLHIARDRA